MRIYILYTKVRCKLLVKIEIPSARVYKLHMSDSRHKNKESRNGIGNQKHREEKDKTIKGSH